MDVQSPKSLDKIDIIFVFNQYYSTLEENEQDQDISRKPRLI